MQSIKLNDGHVIPALGIGTFTLSPDDAENAVIHAIQDGYTLIDTANAYMNEKAVGRAIKRSGAPRESLYVSTKLWPSVYSNAKEAIDETLNRLGLDYVDLLFLHQPVGDVRHAYRAMEDAVKAGKVRSIGLSNFPVAEMEDIVAHASIKPAVLQAEAHPYYINHERQTFLKDNGMVLMSWYPLGHGDHSLLNEGIFARLAKKYHKTPAQIILRWHVQMGFIVIPGSKNPAHIKDNIDIFDFALTDEEMNEIQKLDKEVPYYHQTEEALEGYLRFAPDFNSQK
jgi:diketogulonate reductase-like aldo/keto reductase